MRYGVGSDRLPQALYLVHDARRPQIPVGVLQRAAQSERRVYHDLDVRYIDRAIVIQVVDRRDSA